MLFSLRHHIIPYSLYFFNLSFYPISEKRCTFAAQFMKDRNYTFLISLFIRFQKKDVLLPLNS